MPGFLSAHGQGAVLRRYGLGQPSGDGIGNIN